LGAWTRRSSSHPNWVPELSMYDNSLLKNPAFTSHSWDDVYEREVANFEETGDEGEIW
jgi:hypothetical protein